jgi:hypothetical protein
MIKKKIFLILFVVGLFILGNAQTYDITKDIVKDYVKTITPLEEIVTEGSDMTWNGDEIITYNGGENITWN